MVVIFPYFSHNEFRHIFAVNLKLGFSFSSSNSIPKRSAFCLYPISLHVNLLFSSFILTNFLTYPFHKSVLLHKSFLFCILFLKPFPFQLLSKKPMIEMYHEDKNFNLNSAPDKEFIESNWDRWRN